MYDYTSILNEILSQLKTTPKLVQSFLPFIGAAVTTLLGAWVGYRVSRSHESRRFRRENHFKLLEVLNAYVGELNDIITNIVNIKKVASIMLKEAYSKYDYDINGDFLQIAQKIGALEGFILSAVGIETAKRNGAIAYREQLVKMIANVRSFDLFIKAGETLQKSAVNYLLMVDGDIKTKYQSILEEIAAATIKNMQGFQIVTHKNEVNAYIQKVVKVVNKYS